MDFQAESQHKHQTVRLTTCFLTVTVVVVMRTCVSVRVFI